MKKFALVPLIMSMFVISACGPRQFVKGEYDENVNDTNLLTDKWSESDMQTAVRDLVASATAHPAIAAAKRRQSSWSPDFRTKRASISIRSL